jgi:ABC-type antimicrobial peptide transport system permease subunit
MFRSILKYRYKSALIILSATAAIASIFMITSLGNGIIRMYADMIRTDGDIIVMQKGVADTFFSDVNRSLIAPISRIEGVRSVQGVIVGAGKIDTVPIAGIYGVTPNRYANYHLISGRYPKQPGEVMLGESIQMLLNDPDAISLFGKRFAVTGVYRSQIGFENGGVVIDIADAQKLFKKGASFLLVALKGLDADAQQIMRRIAALDEDIDVKSTADFVANYNQFKIIRVSTGVIASISFLMGFLAIVSLMSIMVNDRMYEFGIKRALGISRVRIIAEIAAEVAMMTLASFLLAYLISLAALEILEHIRKFQGYLSGDIDLSLFVKVLAGTLAMALFGALIPAFIAARTDPVILLSRGRS